MCAQQELSSIVVVSGVVSSFGSAMGRSPGRLLMKKSVNPVMLLNDVLKANTAEGY